MNAADIAKLVAQINPLVGMAVQAITAAKQIRDAVKAAGPQPGVALPTDAELIQKLVTDAGLGKQEAEALRDWAKTLGQ